MNELSVVLFDHLRLLARQLLEHGQAPDWAYAMA